MTIIGPHAPDFSEVSSPMAILAWGVIIQVGWVLAISLAILVNKHPCEHPRTPPTHIFASCFIQIEFGSNLARLHWVLHLVALVDLLGYNFLITLLWLLPSRRLGAAWGHWGRLVIVLRVRLVFFVRGFDPISWSAKRYSSEMLVASWSAPFDSLLRHPSCGFSLSW